MCCHKSLTSWIVSVGRSRALIWRHNMPFKVAMRTYGRRCFGRHGYLMAGPLIVEW
jgi:hypothetical protein